MKKYRQFIEILFLAAVVFTVFLLFFWYFFKDQEKPKKEINNSFQIFDSSLIENQKNNLNYSGILPENQEKEINMIFFGDMMLDRHVGEKIQANSLDYLFNNLATSTGINFGRYNLVSANLEGAVTNGGAHYLPAMSYDFAFNPNLIGQLKKYNFNFFNIANNHLSDQGQKGIAETKKNLKDLGFYFSGCQDKETGDCSSSILEINGQKIGMAGFSMVYGSLDEDKVVETIKNLSEETDLVIINIHWGVEYEHKFNSVQQNLAHQMIDAGADIIIGHHPHVIQGVEVYKNKPIFYSLGNFIFDQYFSPDTQEGLAVGVNIEDGKQTYFLFPFKSKLNQVELLSGKEKEDFYKKIINWSSLEKNIENEVLNGFFEL